MADPKLAPAGPVSTEKPAGVLDYSGFVSPENPTGALDYTGFEEHGTAGEELPPLAPIQEYTGADAWRNNVTLEEQEELDAALESGSQERLPVNELANAQGMPAMHTGEFVKNTRAVEFVREDGSVSNELTPDKLREHIVSNTEIPGAKYVRAYYLDPQTMEISSKDIEASPEGFAWKSLLREEFLTNPFVYASEGDAEDAKDRYIDHVKRANADKDGFSVLLPSGMDVAGTNVDAPVEALAESEFSLENKLIWMYRVDPETGEMQKKLVRGRQEMLAWENEKSGLPFKPLDREGRAYSAVISFANGESGRLSKLRQDIYGGVQGRQDTMAQNAFGAATWGLLPWMASLPIIPGIADDRIVLSPEYAQAGRSLANPKSALAGALLGAVAGAKVPLPGQALARLGGAKNMVKLEKSVANLVTKAIGHPEMADAAAKGFVQAAEVGTASVLFNATDPTLSSEEILSGFGAGAILGGIIGVGSNFAVAMYRPFGDFFGDVRRMKRKAKAVASFAEESATVARDSFSDTVRSLRKRLYAAPEVLKAVKELEASAKYAIDKKADLGKLGNFIADQKAPLNGAARAFEVLTLGVKLATPTGLLQPQILKSVVPNPAARNKAWELLSEELVELGMNKSRASFIANTAKNIADYVRRGENMKWSKLVTEEHKNITEVIGRDARALSKEIRSEMRVARTESLSSLYKRLLKIDSAVSGMNKKFVISTESLRHMEKVLADIDNAQYPRNLVNITKTAEAKLGPLFTADEMDKIEYMANLDDAVSKLIGRKGSVLDFNDVAEAQAKLFNVPPIQAITEETQFSAQSLSTMLAGSAADRASISVVSRWIGAKPLPRKISEISVSEALTKAAVVGIAPELLVAWGLGKAASRYARIGSAYCVAGLALAAKSLFDDSMAGLTRAAVRGSQAYPGIEYQEIGDREKFEKFVGMFSDMYKHATEAASKDLDEAKIKINAGEGHLFIDRAIQYMDELRNNISNFDPDESESMAGVLSEVAPPMAFNTVAGVGSVYANVMNAIPKVGRKLTASEICSFADYAAVAFHPGIVSVRLKDKTLTPRQLESFKDNYPRHFTRLAEEVDTLFNDSEVPASPFVRKLHILIFGAESEAFNMYQQSAAAAAQVQPASSGKPRRKSEGAKKAAVSAMQTTTGRLTGGQQ